jgi:hypothetical protein
MIPGGATSLVFEPRTRMAIWQLANCKLNPLINSSATQTNRCFRLFPIVSHVLVCVQGGKGFGAKHRLARDRSGRRAQGVGNRGRKPTGPQINAMCSYTDHLTGYPVRFRRVCTRGAELTHCRFSVAISFAGLPKEVRWDFRSWNAMTHGNISVSNGLPSRSAQHCFES